MLVICCGMPRSASTLQYQLAVAVLEKTGRGSGTGWVKHAHCRDLEINRSAASIQVIKVHRFDQLEGTLEAISEGWGKGLYIYRDIRDVAVSLMNRNKISFDQLAASQELRGILRDFHAWTSLPGIMVSRYETTIPNLPREVLKIASHLSVKISKDEAEAIANDYTLEKQKKRVEALDNRNLDKQQEYDPKTQLHVDHIHSGKSGQWLQTLNHSEIGYLEYLAHDWLLEQCYPLSQPFYVRWSSRIMLAPKYEPASGINRWLLRLNRGIKHMQHGTLGGALRSKWRQLHQRWYS